MQICPASLKGCAVLVDGDPTTRLGLSRKALERTIRQAGGTLARRGIDASMIVSQTGTPADVLRRFGVREKPVFRADTLAAVLTGQRSVAAAIEDAYVAQGLTRPPVVVPPEPFRWRHALRSSGVDDPFAAAF